MLGTGNPAADPDRFGPATVIIVDSTAYLVDCGVGVIRRWAAAIRAGATGFHISDLRRVFVTHLHSDHTLCYADLILSSWTLGGSQREPIQVFGPEGIQSMTDHLLAAYAVDIRIRSGVGGELAGAPPPRVKVQEIEAGVVYRDSLVTVTAFAVHPGTFCHAFGYRFQTPDKDIVISGDAAPLSLSSLPWVFEHSATFHAWAVRRCGNAREYSEAPSGEGFHAHPDSHRSRRRAPLRLPHRCTACRSRLAPPAGDGHRAHFREVDGRSRPRGILLVPRR
jgi:hypothetical protein